MPYLQTQSRYARLKQLERQKQHNLEWNKYYQDRIYIQNKQHYKLYHPLCEDCLEQDIITPATEIHHIIPFSTGLTEAQKFNLLRNINNLRALCKDCHKKRHKDEANGMYSFTKTQKSENN